MEMRPNPSFPAGSGFPSRLTQQTQPKRQSQQKHKDKELSYSRVISNYRLSDWLKKFCISTKVLHHDDRDTFVDDQGIHRFKETWKEVPEIYYDLETDNYENFFLKTGCMRLSYLYDYFIHQDENNEDENGLKLPSRPPENLQSHAYISEWQRLWIFLENDESDELAEHAPLYRLIIEFLFHPRMQTVMMVLLAYNYLLNIILIALFPTALNGIAIFYVFFDLVVQSVTYFAIVVVYRGIVSQPDPSIFQDEVFALDGHAAGDAAGGGGGGGGRGGAGDNRISDLSDVTNDNVLNPFPTNTTAHHADNIAGTDPSNGQASKKIDIQKITKTTNLKRHFQYVRKELFGRIRYELSLIHPIFAFCFSPSPETISAIRKQKTFFLLQNKKQKRKLSYHEILNISLKFLTRINGINMKKINFDRISYRCIILFIVTIYPLYLFLFQYGFTYFYEIGHERCHGINQPDKENTTFCNYSFWFFVLSGATLTKFFVQLIYGMSVLIALVSLAYGAEVAYRLADSFIVKFKSLRRVEEYDLEEYFFSSAYGPDEEGRVSEKGGGGGGGAGGSRKDKKDDRRKSNNLFGPADRYSKSRVSFTQIYNNNNNSNSPGHPHQRPPAAAEDILAMTHNPMRPNPNPPLPPSNSSNQASNEIAEISRRASFGESSVGSDKKFLHSESDQDISDHPLYFWVKRDATEHYFFICEVFQASDKIWSPALSGIFFICFGTTLVFALFATVSGNLLNIYAIIQIIIYIVVRILILFIYPIVCLCHANRYIYELVNAFKRSSKEDFQLIGGCERWSEFITNCPAAWTFYGLWITWDRLFGMIWTFAAAGMASLIGTLYTFVFSQR